MGFSVDYEILAKSSPPKISGDVRSGYKATVPYLVAWEDAFVFADQLLGGTSSAAIGPITWVLPHRFPGVTARLYAQRFTIEPLGLRDDVSGEPSLKGLSPGEYYSKAKITVEYETPTEPHQASQDKLEQLDPENPIPAAEQKVRSAGKMETRKNGSYLYDGSLKPVPGDFAVPSTESKLTISFARVPYQPWKYIEPFLNTINSAPILSCAAGQLLFTDFDTDPTPSPNGPMAQKVTLNFAVAPHGLTWNHQPQPDGTYALVRIAADKLSGTPRRIYAESDFRQLFNTLAFIES